MRIRAVVDRFEGNKAVLLVGEEELQVIWPKEYCPPNTCEGDIVLIDINVDTELTRQARSQAEKLLRDLTG